MHEIMPKVKHHDVLRPERPRRPRDRCRQGLGEGMAKALAAAGAKVMIADVQESGADAAAALGDGHVRPARRHRRRVLGVGRQATVDPLGGLDILVNNAGIEITQLSPPTRQGPPDARGQRPRDRPRPQARAARDAPGRPRRQGRRDHQRRLGRGDDRLPRHRRVLRDQVGRRPADPRRGDGGRRSATASASIASTPARPHRDGRGTREGRRRHRPVRVAEAAVGAVST